MSFVWIHEDAMSLDHPVMEAAGLDAQPVFIWDSQHHDAEAYALKRRVFIFECALDLDIPIYCGAPQIILSDLADRQTIFTAASLDPYINGVIADLRQTHAVVTVDRHPFASIPDDADTRRFFRFWNYAKKTALIPSEETI